jgi:hypothetical protein
MRCHVAVPAEQPAGRFVVVTYELSLEVSQPKGKMFEHAGQFGKLVYEPLFTGLK